MPGASSLHSSLRPALALKVCGRSSMFADGFAHPLGLAVEPRGGILAGDWGRGVIYRLSKR